MHHAIYKQRMRSLSVIIHWLGNLGGRFESVLYELVVVEASIGSIIFLMFCGPMISFINYESSS